MDDVDDTMMCLFAVGKETRRWHGCMVSIVRFVLANRSCSWTRSSMRNSSCGCSGRGSTDISSKCSMLLDLS